MNIEIPDFCVVVLAGPPGSGRSEFAARHFSPGEIVSADTVVMGGDLFGSLQAAARTRLERRQRVVVDATNCKSGERRRLADLARVNGTLAVAFVFDASPEDCIARLEAQGRNPVPVKAVRRHSADLRATFMSGADEGFRASWVVDASLAGDVALLDIPLAEDKRRDSGPFDIVGDVHGCADELESLLAKLGYMLEWSGQDTDRDCAVSHPEGRRLVFVGDIVDRGPRVVDSLLIAMAAVRAGGYCTVGNHDEKLRKWASGREVTLRHGLDISVAEIESAGIPGFRERIRRFVEGMPSHVWLDGGSLCVVHAGIREQMIGRTSKRVREFCIYGEHDGEADDGMPIRSDWARSYSGAVEVVYGHTPTLSPAWVNGTLCVDTGCVFGAELTAMRWPERELVSVPAAAAYAVTSRAMVDRRPGP